MQFDAGWVCQFSHGKRGAWRWTQIGYGGSAAWADDVIQHLEGVKKSNAAPKSE